MSAFAYLAQMLLVIGRGSIEEHPSFSAASFVLSEHRRRQDKSLDRCVRTARQLGCGKGAKSVLSHNFPYQKALKHWKAFAHKRVRYQGKRK